MEIKPFVATDYNGVIEALRAKKLDIALLGPFSYVLAARVADVEAFAVPETQKQGATYRAVIIARKDRNIASLKDLKGKTFAFVDPSSTSGHLFPKAGADQGRLRSGRYFCARSSPAGHDASAIAVQNGKVDAAAVADGLLETAFTRGMVKREEIAVIWTSDPIPGAPFVYAARSARGSQGESAQAFCGDPRHAVGPRAASSSAGSRPTTPPMTWCAIPPSCSTST